MNNPRIKLFFELEIKKGLALLPSFLLMLSVTVGILAIASAIFCAAMGKDHVLPHLSVAIVSPDQDEMTQTAADLIRDMESVRSIATLDFMDREKAEKQFGSGSVQAIIYLPENLYDSIDSGENLPVTVKISKESGLASTLFRELAESGASLIQTSEASIYALAQVSLTYPLTGSAQDLMNKMAVSYISTIMNRGSVWNETMLSAYGTVTPAMYYALSVMLLTVLLFGTAFAVFYSGGEESAGRLLRRDGVGGVAQSAAKITAMTIVLWILLTAWYFALFLAGFTGFRPAAALLLLFAAFSVSSFVHLIYCFARGESAVFFYAVISIVLFFLSGGIVPKTVFPAWLARIGSALPTGVLEQYLSVLLYGGSFGAAGGRGVFMPASVILYGAAMAAAGTWRWENARL